MPRLQDIVYKFELGGGLRVVRIALGAIAVLFLAMAYDLRAYKHFTNQEAIDMAQVGRNLAEGKGYSTLFIRPLSLAVLARYNTNGVSDPTGIQSNHPDIANPPVYPALLAALFKVTGVSFETQRQGALWTDGQRLLRYPPELLIILMNQALFFGVVLLTFILASRVFDRAVAWVSCIVLLGTELLWRFTVSGLPTIFLMLLFLLLVLFLQWIEERTRKPEAKGFDWLLALVPGVLAGIGGLVSYSFALVIIPVLVFLTLFNGKPRWRAPAIAGMAFLLVMAPWVWRNASISGYPFGVASLAPWEDTALFPGDTLQRTMNPNVGHGSREAVLWAKLGRNTYDLLQEDLPKLGGTWVSAFFLVGLLVGFRNPGPQRVRYFTLGCLAFFAAAQVVSKTHLSKDSPGVNSENLLVLLAPLVLIYGVGLFFLLLDQVQFPAPQVRTAVVGAFCLVVSLPMILVLLPARVHYASGPVYSLRYLQFLSNGLTTNELAMSDIPWAIAWYGQRKCAWLTLDAIVDEQKSGPREDFAALGNFHRRGVSLLVLSPTFLDRGFRSFFLGGTATSWATLVWMYDTRKTIPASFPLDAARRSAYPSYLVLSDYDRWEASRPRPAGGSGG